MPLSLKVVLAVLTFQVLVNAAMGVLLIHAGTEDAEHGRDVPALQHVLAYGSIVAAVVLLVCGVLLMRAVAAARPVVVAVEALGMLSGLLALVQGAPQGTVGLVLSVLVLVHLYRADLTTWLEAHRS